MEQVVARLLEASPEYKEILSKYQDSIAKYHPPPLKDLYTTQLLCSIGWRRTLRSE